MSIEPVEIFGGESVYCINEAQLKKAYEIAEGSEKSRTKIADILSQIENDLNRNEKAALSFLIIDRLLKN